MKIRRSRLSYDLAVEGDTEKWYFNWLARQINSCDVAGYAVAFNIIQDSPTAAAKALTNLERRKLFCLYDTEGDSEEQQAAIRRGSVLEKENERDYSLQSQTKKPLLSWKFHSPT